MLCFAFFCLMHSLTGLGFISPQQFSDYDEYDVFLASQPSNFSAAFSDPNQAKHERKRMMYVESESN